MTFPVAVERGRFGQVSSVSMKSLSAELPQGVDMSFLLNLPSDGLGLSPLAVSASLFLNQSRVETFRHDKSDVGGKINAAIMTEFDNRVTTSIVPYGESNGRMRFIA